MTSPSFLTVNLVSGLAGVGKSSIARASGRTRMSLDSADQAAVNGAIAGTGTRSEVMLEIHPSAVPLEVAVSVMAAGGDLVLQPDTGAIRLGNLVSVLDASSFWRDIRSEEFAPSVTTWLPPQANMLTWLQQSPGWIQQLNGKGLLTSGRNGLGCVVYRDPRPFHPGRLASFLDDTSTESGEILRSRGLFRLASRPHVVGSWNSAGLTIAFEPTSMGSHDPESPWGQEIAFFGRNLDSARLTASLDACLLDDREFIGGPIEWRSLDDPFPAWDLDQDDD